MVTPPETPDAPASPATGPATGTLRVAVVGSGPAGVYACESLLNWADTEGRDVLVDTLDKLPVPFGLLRHGVAPDHPRIKAIAKVLHEIGADPRVRFLGNVEVGTDLTIDDLRRNYHAVVVATGALADRDMGVPGEDAAGSHGAAEFVTWYDGHPDSAREWALDAERAAVVGVGNVALDVARMLVRTPEQLESTDIPQRVHDGYRANSTRVVSVIGRRGPAYAKFTPLELREMGKVEGVTVVVDPADLEYDDEARARREAERRVGQVCTQLESWAELARTEGHENPDDAEAAALAAGNRVVRFRFHRSPVEVLATNGHVSGLRLERTEPGDGGRVRGTGETEDLELQAVYRAVGYRSAALPGLPFDAASATIPNAAGRVVDGVGGETVPGMYVAGWIKRGPSGVIGTNRSCAAETVASLLADLGDGKLVAPAETDPAAVLELLAERGVTVVDGAGWNAIDAAERALGEASGRERTKLSGREEMLEVAAGARV